jgi:hypothetical protein
MIPSSERIGIETKWRGSDEMFWHEMPSDFAPNTQIQTYREELIDAPSNGNPA